MADAGARFHQLYETLRTRICLLDYPPGTQLSETVLAEEFGTSRTPLRRVLARLEDEGLLRSVHGVGTMVTDVDVHEMAQTYALRMELAQLAGMLDPVPVTPEVRAVLDALIARGDGLFAQPDPRHFAQLNLDYFRFGLSLTANQPLRDMSERLYIRTARIWLKSIPRMDLSDEIAVFRDEMAQTRRALAAGDTQAAALIRRAHISLSYARLSQT